MSPSELEGELRRTFPDAEIEIKDLTGTQDHYQARIVSSAFVGKNRIEQHRMVYAALGSAMSGPVHALALATFTPEDWAKARA